MSAQDQFQSSSSRTVLAIHCGAGPITSKNLTPEQEKDSLAVMVHVLESGYAQLRRRGRSLDVVEAAVRQLEDCPFFNAGKGACFTHDGRNELDASIMDGRSGQAGAVAGVKTIRNPISAARAVMERSPHVFLMSPGAEEFAREQGLEMVEPSYFFTQRQYDKLEAMKRAEAEHKPLSEEKMGTVGAVALDSYGDLAAATSTGGMMNKRFGRIGDSPIIGAGTYANNATCAVSATGHGEFFIRHVVAYDISALMNYKGLSLQEAVEEVLRRLGQSEGTGGVIAIDKEGQIAIEFNTPGMYRGSIEHEGEAWAQVFGSGTESQLPK